MVVGQHQPISADHHAGPGGRLAVVPRRRVDDRRARLDLGDDGLLAAGQLGSRRTRSRYPRRSRQGNARAAGPRAVEGQESACRERQGAPPTSPPPAARPRQSPAEFAPAKLMLPGADRVPGLGVDLGEAGQVTEFVELGGGDVAGGVLDEEDGVEDPDYLLVDLGQRAREAIRRSRSHPGTRRRDIQWVPWSWRSLLRPAL
jgi:hypothetical protein